jgi:hypothetical protein
MRTFIRHNAAGEILSVCRTDFVSPYLTTPFGDVGLDETVLEVTDRRVLADLSVEEIHDSYKVSVSTGKLIKTR